ncbi:MAG: alpha/beta hydrolase-fold protein [Bacteroidota bacterium]
MAAFLFSLIALCAQGSDIVIGQQVTIKSEILKEQRRFAVFTPKDYLHSDEKYQVLYLLDGEWNFNFVSSLVDKLASSGDVPKMIVIGIINNNRSKDLTPAGSNDNKSMYGGAELFLRHLTEELQPWVDRNYRTLPFSVLAGHSFGGLFTVYGMMQHPGAFQAYIAISPSLGRNNEQQVIRAKEFFSSKNRFPQSLYLGVGNEGGFTYFSSKRLADVLEGGASSKLRFKFDHLSRENHVSITTQGFIEGLKFTYAGFNPERVNGLDEIFLIETHYQSLSNSFGYRLKVPEKYYYKFAREQIAEKELEYALFILDKYQKEYPNSSNLLSCYADLYLLKGEFENARNYYLRMKKRGVESEYLESVLKQLKE